MIGRAMAHLAQPAKPALYQIITVLSNYCKHTITWVLLGYNWVYITYCPSHRIVISSIESHWE